MARDAARQDVIAKWFDKIDAKRRVKAVCKPCWEIQYCPYGPLVEQFPLAEPSDERGCRIFGHVCPVFHVAEPFTETKELRAISRTIPRPVQFRVLKRENQICRKCGQPVRDDEVHFDHIIPWSKGGSSDERNIQLLCGDCNRKKGNRFEAEHLVPSFGHLVVDPVGFDILEFFVFLVGFAFDFKSTEDRFPDADDFAERLNNGEKTFAEEQGAATIQDLDSFFSGEPPQEISAKVFKALRLRWGFHDGDRHHLKSAAEDFAVDIDDLLAAEISLVTRLGWRIALNKKEKNKWLRS